MNSPVSGRAAGRMGPYLARVSWKAAESSFGEVFCKDWSKGVWIHVQLYIYLDRGRVKQAMVSGK